ncbi:uncharacterized protein LOC120777355 [Bactrocera tryoni]|uniref:uncharacterized protein LOC120777355 n=1 Tax=Bactrocera tryoni TaxID=59916 RepID=UPI001A98A85C|nr:uncharacterized protein LOC120777355 [Bactrocera tryoni]
MITDSDFILAIKLYPELCHIYKENRADAEERNKELWSQFARDHQLKNGTAAKLKWSQIISQYVSFLMYGTPFHFEREMQFMQMPLLGAGLEDNQSDSDIDETELNKVLKTFEEFPTDIGKQHIRTSATDIIVSKKRALVKGQGNELNEADFVNTEKHYETVILDSNNYNKNESEVKVELAVNKLSSKQNGLNTMVSTEDMLTDFTASTHAQAAIKSSEDTAAPGGFSSLTSLELIFLGYAKVLQRMPLRLQLQTKRKIADIMDEAELKLFEDK